MNTSPEWGRRRVALRLASLFFVFLVGTTCGSGESPTGPSSGALFLIRACHGSEHAPDGELFRVLIRDRDVISRAEDLIGRGQVMIIAGPLREGDGGFNQPWSWHIDPDEVGISEGAIEVCDGCPSFVEADLEYWLGTVKTYCPWSSEVVSRLR